MHLNFFFIVNLHLNILKISNRLYFSELFCFYWQIVRKVPSSHAHPPLSPRFILLLTSWRWRPEACGELPGESQTEMLAHGSSEGCAWWNPGPCRGHQLLSAPWDCPSSSTASPFLKSHSSCSLHVLFFLPRTLHPSSPAGTSPSPAHTPRRTTEMQVSGERWFPQGMVSWCLLSSIPLFHGLVTTCTFPLENLSQAMETARGRESVLSPALSILSQSRWSIII